MASKDSKQKQLKSVDSLGVLDAHTFSPDGLNLRKELSQDVRSMLKGKTAYGLTQSIAKWLLVDEHQELLSCKFVCIRWSQTKGFVVLKRVKANLILFVDLLGAMNELMKSQNEDVNDWLQSNFTFNTQSKQKIQKKDDNDEKEANKKEVYHKIITLKGLYEVLTNNWGESNIKVADHASVNSVIEFRIVASKRCNNFYQSLDDLFHLLESDNEEEKHVKLEPLDKWLNLGPHCLKLKDDMTINVSLSENAHNDTLISGSIFSIYDAKDGSLFLTIQYDVNNKNMVAFAHEYLKGFDLDEDNLLISGALKIKDLMSLLQKLLKENNLKIDVSDDYYLHQEILFIVKDK